MVFNFNNIQHEFRERLQFHPDPLELESSELCLQCPEDERYLVWVNSSLMHPGRLVLKIHAPFCKSLKKAVDRIGFWRHWSFFFRVWELELREEWLESIIDEIKNDKLRSLLEHFLYYFDWDAYQSRLINELTEIRSRYLNSIHVNLENVIYGIHDKEFIDGLIAIKENNAPNKQHLRVFIFAHHRFYRELVDAIKNLGYELTRHHYDPGFHAWVITISNEQMLEQLIQQLDYNRTQWIHKGLGRLRDWFGKQRFRKIKAFEPLRNGEFDLETLNRCLIPLKSGFSIIL